MKTLTQAQLGRLQAALDAKATAKSRAFWSKYLKGNAAFRGVPMAGVREVVHAWWRQEALGDFAPAAQTRAALRLFEETPTEDKLAGVIALPEILLPHLSTKNLPAFARLFGRGLIADWNLCDWFCVKVLGKMVEHADAPVELAQAISAWRSSKPLWQRRASCVAFVNHAKHGDTRIPGLSALILENADTVVRDPTRFAQTGVGWVLRELSLANREAVVTFCEVHVDRMSREGLRYTAEKMPAAQKKRLLTLRKSIAGVPLETAPKTKQRSRSAVAPKHSELRRPRHAMPAFVSRALDDHELRGAYNGRPPYQRNDYIGWINAAKRQETKDKRLAQMLDELRRGGVYMRMAWGGSSAPGQRSSRRVPGGKRRAASVGDKIEVENINTPGRTERVDRAKYEAMRKALLEVLPASAPGLTVAEAKEKLAPLLPEELFPGGAKAMWWFKAAQLDLEAKGVIKRAATKPMRLHKAR